MVYLRPRFPKLSGETDLQLQARARTLRERARGGASLDRLLPETFALVREASSRTLGMRHFDVQVRAGVALHRRNIVEMKTGEGKTLVATLPVVLHALAGNGVHVITVNDYLARRDAEWMRPLFEFLGLSVGVVTEDTVARAQAYAADITYLTNHELVFDYLRDNLAHRREDQVQRGLSFAVVDEVDLLLLDEAGMPLIISGEAGQTTSRCGAARRIVALLEDEADYRVDHKTRRASFRESGWTKLEQALGVENLAAPEQLEWQHALHNALLARAVYQRDVHYIVREDQILLVDDFTGRVSPDKRFSDGLHQALEAKEGVTVRAEDRTLAKVSYQMFFRQYEAFCGMTGTAHSAREEIERTYGLRVVVVPTNRPMVRVDEPSLVFRSAGEKFRAVVERIAELVATGRPVLVGTTSVRESEQVAALLSARGIEHAVLNAKDDRAEAAIIAQAGRLGAVTVSTNMAGRGVDILLGGNPAARDDERAEPSARPSQQERDRVVAAGGLMVIGTGLHESRRIDDQLRGRAGRQGDPGGSQYFLSLDDPIYQRFGEMDRGDEDAYQLLGELRARLREHPQGQPVRDRGVLRALRELQRKVEIENEAIRRDVLRYDLIVDDQRRTIYGWRQLILDQQADQTVALVEEMAEDLEHDLADAPRTAEAQPTALEAALGRFAESVAQLEAAMGLEELAGLLGEIALSTIDELWTDHLGELERLEEAIGLRGYAQLDPLVEYRREAHELYRALLAELRARVVTSVVAIAERA